MKRFVLLSAILTGLGFGQTTIDSADLAWAVGDS